MSAKAEPVDYPEEPDRAPGCASPRETYDLYGHEAGEHLFDRAFQSGHLHHAWLLAGPRGIGKATLAYRMARRVLGARTDTARGILGSDPTDPVCHRIAAMSHGDLLTLRRPFDDKRKRWRAEITVEEARRMAALYHTRAGEGGWRVCIIDAADELNLNAANALLKMLEEPPARALIILIAHAPGRLPVTIRSRCRQLDLRPLDEETTTKIVISHGAGEKAARLASTLSAGSPGRALALVAADGASLWSEVDKIVSQGPRAGQGAALALARRLAMLKAAPQRKLFFELLLMRIEQEIRAHCTGAEPFALERWFDLRDGLQSLARDMERLYLDPAQVINHAIQDTWRTASMHRLKTQES